MDKVYIQTAGVYRCCINSIGKQTSSENKEGDRLECRHCGEKFYLEKLQGDQEGLCWRPDRTERDKPMAQKSE